MGSDSASSFHAPNFLVSIHAPRVGSDGIWMFFDDTGIVSIHAPRVGSDPGLSEVKICMLVSIHAPRVGSDALNAQVTKMSDGFNPRSPCGERQGSDGHGGLMVVFQSTLPVWGATRRLQYHTVGR